MNKTEQNIMEYILFRVTQKVPFIALVYDELEITTDISYLSGEDEPMPLFFTDGVKFYCNMPLLLKAVKDNKEKNWISVEMAFLHELFHVYYGHPFIAKTKDDRTYNKETNAQVNMWLQKLYSEEQIKAHHYPMNEEELPPTDIRHEIWYEKYFQDNYSKAAAIWEQIQDNLIETVDSKSEEARGRQAARQNLKKGHNGGYEKGEDQPLNYIETLKKYLYYEDTDQEIDEEIDFVLYSHSQKLYDDILLVEAPEYQSIAVVSVCIAIDTSGSCVGKVVENFISQTYSVMEKISQGGKLSMNIYILLCDTEIQQEIEIHKLKDFPTTEEWKISGGGTDFRPVFQRVEELIKEHVLEKKTALFYYTDGFGTYPEQPPSFDTYFLMERDYVNKPSWVNWVSIK